jgi:hypothetical protein
MVIRSSIVILHQVDVDMVDTSHNMDLVLGGLYSEDKDLSCLGKMLQ